MNWCRWGSRLIAESTVIELVRRVADDYIELHVSSEHLGDPTVAIVGVDERVGVGFKALATIQGVPGGATVPCICPTVQVCLCA